MVLGLDDPSGDRFRQTRGDRPDRLFGSPTVRGGEIGRRHRRADRELDRSRPKSTGIVEGDADGQERHGARSAGGALRAQGQTRGARPQRQQDRLRLRPPLGKDQDDAARAQRLDRGREHRLVLSRVVAGLEAAVDGHCAQHAQRGTDERVAKERCVGQHRHRPGHGRDDQHRVDHRVVVVGGNDHAAARRDPLAPDHVDPTVEEPEKQANHRPDKPVGERPLCLSGLRPRSRVCRGHDDPRVVKYTRHRLSHEWLNRLEGRRRVRGAQPVIRFDPNVRTREHEPSSETRVGL